jgi:hypothetical protein
MTRIHGTEANRVASALPAAPDADRAPREECESYRADDRPGADGWPGRRGGQPWARTLRRAGRATTITAHTSYASL